MNVQDWDRAHLWNFRARLIRVKDADTILVLSDTGYRGRHEPALRLSGIHAPENSTPEGKKATEWLSVELIRTAIGPHSWPLRVRTIQRETVVEEATTFERWVSDVWLVVGGGENMVGLQDMIVAAGHATRTAP